MADDPTTGADPRHARKVRDGVVVSNKMDKTAVVAVASGATPSTPSSSTAPSGST
jgi:hypothetical protein